MTDTPPPSPPSPEPPSEAHNVPLEYASPALDPNRPAGGVPFILQILIGFVSYFVAVGIAIGLASLLAYGSNDVLSMLIIGGILTLLVLAFFATYAWVFWRWRGVVVGMAIPFGLSLLACGLCWAIVPTMIGTVTGPHPPAIV